MPAQIGRQRYRVLTRTDVLAAVTIAILGAALLLETRAHRNLFYLAALPVFLLRLPTFDWRSLADALIARLALAYIGYFLLSALWSDGFSWPAFEIGRAHV